MSAAASSSSSSLSTVRKHDTQRWLERHALKSSETFIRKNYQSKILEWMTEGVAMDDRPHACIAENIHFTDTEIPTKFIKSEAISPQKIERSTDVIINYDSSRLQSGLNPSTLMTEYKRKIILQSLLKSESIAETVETSERKTKFYLTHKEDFRGVSAGDGLLSAKKDKRPTSPGAAESDFHPKWKDYDTMKNRWQYIGPQVRGLKTSTIGAPTSPEKSCELKDGKLMGSYHDIDHYLQKRKQRGV